MGFWQWFGNQKWSSTIPPIESERDLTGVFAIAHDEPWWLAVHQVVNEVEKEIMTSARGRIRKVGSDSYGCVFDVGGTECAAMIRLRLIEKRGLALKQSHAKKIA